MGIDPGDIAAGKCFVTAGEQVRRVLGTRGADVFYEIRLRGPGAAAWGPKKTVSIANFAATVVREVECDEGAPPPAEPSAGAQEPASEPASDPVAEIRTLLDQALAAGTPAEKLSHLYAAADRLVQAIEAMERSAAGG